MAHPPVPGRAGGAWHGRRPGPARQANLRQHNLGLVLRRIVDAAQPPSRADLAAATGLTRATVSALVDRLVAGGLVVELPAVADGRAGRPAVPLAPAGGGVAGVGLEVNVDYLGARAVDLAGRVIDEEVEDDDFRGSDPTTVLPRLAQAAGRLLDRLAAAGVAVAGTCLALPGLVDRVTGPLRLAPNLGWRDVDVLALLAPAGHPPGAGGSPLGAHVPRLANEANLAARAEAFAVRATGLRDFLYISGEVGIGAAIVLDGQVFVGRHGWSGELGHTVVDPAGPACTCGSVGCLERYAGKDALMDGAGLDRRLPVSALAAAAAEGRPAALDALARAGRALGLALGNFVNLVDVDRVVLGGTYAQVAVHLLGPVEGELRARVLSAPWGEPSVRASVAGERAAMTGAALSVLGRVIDDPTAYLSAAAG